MKLAKTKSTGNTAKKEDSAITKSSVNKLSFQADPTNFGAIIPNEVAPLFASVSASLGIDISNPESWTIESINLVQQNKEKFKQALEWLPIVEDSIKAFLELQVGKAEFFARVCKQMFGAKKKVDKASAGMLCDFFSYQVHGQRLNNQLQRKQQLTEIKNQKIENLQEDELTAAVGYLNAVETLAGAEIGRKYELKASSAQVLTDWRTQKRERREYVKVGHLSGAKVGQSASTQTVTTTARPA